MAYVVRCTYIKGTRTNGTRTHAQSRGDLIRGMTEVTNWVRNGWGFDLRAQHVNVAASVTLSFGLTELHMGGNTYAREMVRSDRPNHIYFLGNLPGRPSMFATPIQLGLFWLHGLGHVNKLKASPRADKHGHSGYDHDWFSYDCGQRMRDPSIKAWLRKKCGMIPGWKPKAKAIAETDEMMTLAMPSMGQDFDVRPCGCGG